MTTPAKISITSVASTHGRRISAICWGDRRSSSAASDPAMRKMSSEASCPTISTTSSTVIVPTRRFWSSIPGTATTSYFPPSRATAFPDHVRGVLGRHLVEDAGHLALLELLHQLEQRGVVELVDDLPGALLREQAKQRDLLGQRQVPGDGGDVGRMGLVQRHPVAGVRRALHEPVGRFGEGFKLAPHPCPTR